MPSITPREQWLERTENARRAARFKFAAERLRKIAGGNPPLTDQQRAELVAILTQARGPA
jgi:hypothetical protein